MEVLKKPIWRVPVVLPSILTPYCYLVLGRRQGTPEGAGSPLAK